MTEEEFNALTEEKQQKVLELIDEGKSDEEISLAIEDAPSEFAALMNSEIIHPEQDKPIYTGDELKDCEPFVIIGDLHQPLKDYDPSILMDSTDLAKSKELAAPIKKGKKVLIDEDECMPPSKLTTKQKTDKRPIIKKLRKALRGDAYGIREG